MDSVVALVLDQILSAPCRFPFCQFYFISIESAYVLVFLDSKLKLEVEPKNQIFIHIRSNCISAASLNIVTDQLFLHLIPGIYCELCISHSTLHGSSIPGCQVVWTTSQPSDHPQHAPTLFCHKNCIMGNCANSHD